MRRLVSQQVALHTTVGLGDVAAIAFRQSVQMHNIDKQIKLKTNAK